MNQPVKQPTAPEVIHHTVKEMATALGRSEDYVGDMKRGGFRLPATLSQAVEFCRENGPVTRFRTRTSLYGHRPSCKAQENNKGTKERS